MRCIPAFATANGNFTKSIHKVARRDNMRVSKFLLSFALILGLSAMLSSCSSATTPPDDGSVLCGDDDDCPYGQYCDNGVCQTSSVPCDEQDSCHAGMTCRNGVCVEEGDGAEPDPEPDIEVVQPALTGDPPVHQLNFGNVLIGVTVSQQVVLRNVGDADLQIVQINFEAGSGADDFSISQEQLDSLPVTVLPNEQTVLDVLYTASDGLTDHAILDIISNDPDEALIQIHLLSEFKGDPLAAVSPQTLSFGDIGVGVTSSPLSFLISNQGTGNAVLLVEDVRFGILANPDFDLTILDADSQEVSPPVFVNNGDFLEVDVVYHPQAREDDSDEVVVVSDDPINEILSVAISGRGVLGDIEIIPSPVDLGRVRVNEHGETEVTITNAGGAPLSLTGVYLEAGISAEWMLSSIDLDLADLVNNPHELAPSEFAVVTLAFDPLDIGLEEGNLIIDNTTEEPQRVVALTANGFIPASVETDPDPSTLLFGSVQIDFGSGFSEKKTLDLIIKNVGGEPLQINNIERASLTSPEFTFEPQTILPIDVGLEATIQVSFEPMDLGGETGAIIIDTNDPDIQADSVQGRFKIDLLANGIDPNIFVDPASQYDFGDVYVGMSQVKQVKIRNAGTGPLVINTIELSAGSSPDYVLQNLPPPDTVISNPSIEVTFDVVYTPDVLGPDAGAISITSSDIGVPLVNIELTGTGGECPVGTIDCDGNTQNGCERPCVPSPSGEEECNYIDDDCDCDTDEDFDLDTDPDHCGNCTTVCSYPFAEPGCVDGECTMLTCIGGYEDCNNNDIDGCEIDTDTDEENCGDCDDQCSFANADAQCLAGICIMGDCDTGFLDCDGSDVNGCEVNRFFDVDNCGSCNNRCLYTNGIGTCLGGTCVLLNCVTDWDDCDNNDSNGCEINTSNDPDNCGFCFNDCPDATGTPICNDGTCEISDCDPGLGDCDANPADCETNLYTDVNNCGECDFVCSLPHATPDCVVGNCTVDTCDANWGNCDLIDDPNGCETDLTNTVTDCQFCGNVCTFDHAAAQCIDSTCELGACDQYYWDIDGIPGNGCECLEDDIVNLCQEGSVEHLGEMPSGTTDFEISNNLVPVGDQDWYSFTVQDNNPNDISSGNDEFYLNIRFHSNPGNQYAFTVHTGNITAGTCGTKQLVAERGGVACASEYLQYEKTYNCTESSLPKSCRSTSTVYNRCRCIDNSAKYWLVIQRVSGSVNCDPYSIYIDFTQ